MASDLKVLIITLGCKALSMIEPISILQERLGFRQEFTVTDVKPL